MKQTQLKFSPGFHVIHHGKDSQAASMRIESGKSVGGPNNQHPTSDQWLYVVEGSGEAVVNEQTISLHAGMLVLIQAGETHEIRNKSSQPLATLNIYSPPAY